MSGILTSLAGGADRIVVVDTETTGLYNSDRVVEIATVTLSLQGEVVDIWETLVQPERDVSATHIHGITASMVAAAPTFAEIAGDLALRLHGACLAAHNLPFDYRMLNNEFQRLGFGLSMTAGVDTLVATGRRLHVACGDLGISLTGAHRALADAKATAQLVSVVRDSCEPGAPAALPVGLHRTGKVYRREDTGPVHLEDPPLIVLLASRLAHSGVETKMLSYLDVLDRAIADLYLDAGERADLAHLAHELGLTDAQIAQAHRRFINELVDAAVDDEDVTSNEYETLIRAAAALEIEQKVVEARIRPYREAATSVELVDGMTIVFTGDHPVLSRQQILEHALSIGLVPQKGVARTTQLLAAVDPASNSGKAAKARSYGIPVVAVDDVLNGARGDTCFAVRVDGESLIVVTCPDCLATSTANATSGAHRRRRCDECAAASFQVDQKTNSMPNARSAWAPPNVERLTCTRCTAAWQREVVKGRKPRMCPTCASK